MIFGFIFRDEFNLECDNLAESKGFSVAINDKIEKKELLLELAEKENLSSLNERITYVVFNKESSSLILHCGRSPMVIGACEKGYYFSTSLISISSKCEKYLELEENKTATIFNNRLSIINSNGKKEKPIFQPMPSNSYIENHYTYGEEIISVSSVIKEAYQYLTKDGRLNLKDIRLNHRELERIDQIILTGSGNSYFVAKTGESTIELLTDVTTRAIPANELMSTKGIIDKSTLVVAISHFGENLDTIDAVKRARRNGAKIITITDNNLSYLARTCKNIINPNCDFSSLNYSLCAYQVDYFALTLLGIYLGGKIGYMSDLYISVTLKLAEILQGKLGYSTRNKNELIAVAREISGYDQIIITGYNSDYGIAQEVASKIRTISQLPAFSLPIDQITPLPNTIIIPIISNSTDLDIISPYLKSVKDKAPMLIFTTDTIAEELEIKDGIVTVGDSLPLFNPITLTTSLYQTTLLLNSNKNNESSLVS